MAAGRIQRILMSQHKFLYELHGNFDDDSTWVFGETQLRSLYKQPGYQQFLNTIFSQFMVLFLGLAQTT